MRIAKVSDTRARVRKAAVLAVSAAVACGALTACGGSGAAGTSAPALKDGTYTAQSSVFEDDEHGSGYGVLTMTVSGGKITDAEFLTYEPDGTLKDADYGKTANDNQAFYNMAQKAVEACSQYADELVEKGTPDAVDVVSGATVNYNEFLEAADAAIADASR